MVPIDAQIINARIAHIRENLKFLREYAKMSSSDFSCDRGAIAAAERMLQTAIEAMLDIGNHIIANESFEQPMDYKEVFLILGKNGVIPKKLVKKFMEMVKFRNVIVHGYLGVDSNQIYKVIKNELGDFERFIKIILRKEKI